MKITIKELIEKYGNKEVVTLIIKDKKFIYLITPSKKPFGTSLAFSPERLNSRGHRLHQKLNLSGGRSYSKPQRIFK